MSVRLRARLTLTMLASLLVAVGVLAAALLDRFQDIFEATGADRAQRISEAIREQLHGRMSDLAAYAATDLEEPLDVWDLARIGYYSRNLRAHTDVEFIRVFDGAGQVIFEAGTTPSTGENVGTSNRSEMTLAGNVPQIWSEGGYMHAEAPIRSGDEILGGVRVSASLAPTVARIEAAQRGARRLSSRGIQDITRATMAITVLLTIAAAVFAYMVALRLTRPIEALADMARDVGAGRYDSRIRLGRDDELGELADAMGAMADARRRAEAALAASEKRFRDYARAAADHFWETDADHRFRELTPRPDGSELPGGDVLLGKTRWEAAKADPAAEPWRSHIADLDARRPFREFRYTFENEAGRDIHLRVSGTPVFDDSGRFMGYRGTTVSETAEVEARQNADRIRGQFFEAMGVLSHGFILWDDENRFVTCNTRYFELFPEFKPILEPGVSHEEFIRRAAASPAADKLAGGAETFFRARADLSGGGPPTTLIQYDGRHIQMERRRLKDGFLVAFHFDITDLKLREDELRQAQKMEAVGQLTGGVAHDFNNLLAGILGNLELIAARVGDNADLAARVRRAINAVQRGATLTDRLVAFSRKQQLEPRAVDLPRLVDGMLEIIQRTLGSGVRFAFEAAGGLWPAFADHNQVETSLLNLILNASQAMPAGGEVTIQCANRVIAADAGPPAAGAPDVPPGDYVALSVVDTGSGIAPGDLEHVFEPFFTTKDTGVGSGLGLSMVYGFAKQSGGDVTITSAPGAGTTVTIYLPRAEAAEATAAPHPAVARLPRGAGQTILLIEDDQDVREVTGSMLGELGYRLVDGGDGSDLERALAECHGALDLLLCDIVLPGGRTGYGIADEVVGGHPGVCVLLMTGYTEGSLPRGSGAGYSRLDKPFTMEELAARVAGMLRGDDRDPPV